MAQKKKTKSKKGLFQEKTSSLTAKARSFKKHSSTQIIGVIHIPIGKGFGFVKTDKNKEFFIPKNAVAGAVDGDTVEIELDFRSHFGKGKHTQRKGPTGRVVAIVKRERTHLACIVLEKLGKTFLAYAPLLGPEKAVLVRAIKGETIREGDRIVCKVTSWNNEDRGVEALMTQKIGNIADPSCDVKAAIEEFELAREFPPEVIEEAKSFGTKVHSKGRKDCSHLVTITIDPDTAKDFDDALSLTVSEKGHYHLGVHIADVAFYVKKGSHLDKEAFRRGNSTYFPGTCLPMLPEELSNELCSLKPDVTRLTLSVFAEFSPDGTLLNHEIARTCIVSCKRYTYKEAFAILEGKKKSEHLPLLEKMVNLCRLLQQKRRDRGSIEFTVADCDLIVDKHGVPLHIEQVEYDVTHQLVEEFMLKANEIVARHIDDQDKGLIYRVHGEPDPEAFEEFFQFTRVLGFQLPAKPTHVDIQKLFHEAKGSPLLQQLSISFIRSMKIALYSPENIGHFGLALEHYCHFTSPIRRYPDLIIQRLLCNEEGENLDLDAISAACSERERISMRAEGSVTLLKKMRLAATSFHHDPEKIYPARVTKVRPFALFFEVPEFALEGSLHVSLIGRDFFEYNPASFSFHGKRTGRVLNSGTPIMVRLLKVDLTRQQAEWQMVP